MTYTRTSPIIAPAIPLDLEALFIHWRDAGAYRLSDLSEYLHSLSSGAVTLHLDPVCLLAQWDLETDTGRSVWWRVRLNPAGLGITGDPKQNDASQLWSSGSMAALGHLAHMVAYVWGEDWVSRWPDVWPDPPDLDQRFGLAVMHYGGQADELQDLNGTWAIDPENDYGGKLAARANRILAIAGKGEPVSITFGNVPHPPFKKRIVDNSKAWNNLGKRTIRGVVWHRMIGTLWGTDKYFRTDAVERALTDYGIGVAAHEPDDSGTILMWNDPEGVRSPWANGSLKAPYGDGLKFYERYGVNGINRDLVSIEMSGKTWDTPLDAKSRAAIIALTAHWADQYEVPWEIFPMVPGEDRSFVMWHQEFTIGTGKVCPGNVVMAETSALLAQTKELLKNYQTAPPVPAPDPQYAVPQPVPLGTRLINDRLFLGVTETYTVRRQVTPRLWAEPTSPATGPDLMPGVNVKATHVVKDVGIESDLTIVLEDGSRIAGSSLVSNGV